MRQKGLSGLGDESASAVTCLLPHLLDGLGLLADSSSSFGGCVLAARYFSEDTFPGRSAAGQFVPFYADVCMWTQEMGVSRWALSCRKRLSSDSMPDIGGFPLQSPIAVSLAACESGSSSSVSVSLCALRLRTSTSPARSASATVLLGPRYMPSSVRMDSDRGSSKDPVEGDDHFGTRVQGYRFPSLSAYTFILPSGEYHVGANTTLVCLSRGEHRTPRMIIIYAQNGAIWSPNGAYVPRMRVL